MDIFNALINKDKKIAVLGLGYVGLPLALTLARKYTVIGYDHNPDRVKAMQKHQDPSQELSKEDFLGTDIVFTSNEGDLSQAHFFIVAVPTPVDDHKVPDLSFILKASHSVGKALKKGDYVVFESTVYPGCTEEDCLPILLQESGFKNGLDFKLGYSPERINPGDKVHSVQSISKVVSGEDEEALDQIAAVYGEVITAGVFKAKSIKVAEAAKVIENTQRDLNISFVNELSIIFDKMNINTQDVLDAASTKWNFLPFHPGLVGGHCIGVDPYYLLHKSKEIGYDPEVILSGRRVNDGMPAYIAKKLIKLLVGQDKSPTNSRVLVMGVTFKENVSDIRNSKVAELVRELQHFGMEVDAYDPMASSQEVMENYGFHLIEKPGQNYDVVVVAVNHDNFKKLTPSDLKGMMTDAPILIDIKGIYRHQDLTNLNYWSL